MVKVQLIKGGKRKVKNWNAEGKREDFRSSAWDGSVCIHPFMSGHLLCGCSYCACQPIPISKSEKRYRYCNNSFTLFYNLLKTSFRTSSVDAVPPKSGVNTAASASDPSTARSITAAASS